MVLFAHCGNAIDNNEHAFDTHANLSGLWQDSDSGAINNAYMIIAQEGNAIFVAHYLEFKGQPMVEYGAGVRNGDTIRYSVKVSRGIDGWAETGIHHLTLSPDGNTLSGHFKDSLGNTGPIEFNRKGL